MQNYNYYYPPLANYIDDQRALLYNANLPPNNNSHTPHQTTTQTTMDSSSSSHPALPGSASSSSNKSNPSKVLRETPTKREERLTRNAQRMRERRSMETDEERRKRLDKNALSNRIRRLNESPDQKVLRQARNAARQRLRRAMETQDERDKRLKKLSERMREVRSKDDIASTVPYTPRRPKSESKKQSSYSEDDSFETSVSVESNPNPALPNHNNMPNSAHFFGGNASLDSNSMSINSNHAMIYYNSHNLPHTPQIIPNNHAEQQKSFFSSLKLSPLYNHTVSHHHHQQQQQQQQPHQHLQIQLPQPSPQLSLDMDEDNSMSSQFKYRRESPAARERRLVRNAERMRQRRAMETPEERRERLDKNALNNRLRRMREQPDAKAQRQVRDATRQRIRRALESDDERDCRLKKLAERMREVRKGDSPDDNKDKMVTVKAQQQEKNRLQKGSSIGGGATSGKGGAGGGARMRPEDGSGYFNQFQTNAAYTNDSCTLNIPQYHSIFQSSASGLYKQHEMALMTHGRVPLPPQQQQQMPSTSNNRQKSNAINSQQQQHNQQRKKPKEGDHQQQQLFFSEAQTTALILEPIIEMNTLHTFDTQYSADSVEWRKNGDDDGIFVCGTYQLEERDEDSSKSKRKGRIYLFEFDAENLSKLQQIETEAILDQKWYAENVLITATSLGKLQFYEYQGKQLNFQFDLALSEGGNGGEENLALSIDISEELKRVAASDSTGQISIVDVDAKAILNQWKAHEFEAWTCAFDKFNSNIIYSGGDDSKFCAWDCRTSENVCKLKTKSRDAGVTSFLSYRENQLFVGSYDENLSIYDTRNLKQSVDDINLGGGIWRIKQSKIHEHVLLVACMYHNFSIVDCSSNNKLKLIGEYDEHKSICYGCDWSPRSYENYQFFASCSFYDHRLSLCRVKLSF